MKVYKSKSGKSFGLVDYAKPAEGEIVYFTKKEFEWMKSQGLKPEEFDFYWLSKKEDHCFQIIPDSDIQKTQTIADRYCTAIKTMLLTGQKVEFQENETESKSETVPKVVEERGWSKRIKEKDEETSL